MRAVDQKLTYYFEWPYFTIYHAQCPPTLPEAEDPLCSEMPMKSENTLS